MKEQKTSEYIIEQFIKFFQSKEHRLYSDAPLIPKEQDSTMFTIAGMKQFSNIFLGEKEMTDKRVITIQPCLRVGGKQNDLDEVGKTRRHNTFFYMLGNFSFGDYFKKEAIDYAYEFLNIIKLWNKDRIYITIHNDDDESFKFWQKYEIKNIFRLKDNFWEAGNTGPCGPCTEIYYNTTDDLEIDALNSIKEGNGKLLELWNIVFIEYNRISANKIVENKMKSIDTGAGLERLCSVFDKTYDNFQTDLLKPIVDLIPLESYINKCIVADHMRSICKLMNEGLLPGANERNYVLRKLIRLSVSLMNKNNLYEKKISLLPLVEITFECLNMSKESMEKIKILLEKEENLFLNIIKKGKTLIERQKEINEEVLYHLYETNGIPIDVSQLILKEMNIDFTINWKKIEECKNKHIKVSKTEINYHIPTEDLCYSHNECNSKIVHIEENNIITEKSCFFAKGGGQEGDIGILVANNKEYKIINTLRQKITLNHSVIIHVLNDVSGLNVGTEVFLAINEEYRQAHANSHSAIHLCTDYLEKKYGYICSGSFAGNNEGRIDFTINEENNIAICEELNEYVNSIIEKKIISNVFYEEIIEENVKKHQKDANSRFVHAQEGRVVQFDDYSKQFCCGTHVQNTSEIIKFNALKFQKIGSNIKRLIFVTANI